ncbi:RNA polymerase sigma factor [Roseivirga sp. BDSF3-8]|uniref:RNA polymerase sigma factor n=1 Tax=Roseivirga sp. BDSF3-8 TaxID=3241598 RepID=UPI0035326B4F
MKLRLRKVISEKQLAEGCRQKDRKIQRQVYEHFSPLMFTVCKRYISDASQAEEVMLGGFMKVYEKIDMFEGNGSFEGWIRRIMVNESLSWLRKHKILSLQVSLEEARDESEQEVADHLVTNQDLMNLIAQLPDGYRTVFNLYAIEGYGHKEIAQKTGITESTSKSQLSRARQMLQRNLKAIQHEAKKKICSHEA